MWTTYLAEKEAWPTHGTSEKHYSPFSEQVNFELHKRHSNVPSLEQSTPEEQTTQGQPIIPQGERQSYAKDHLGGRQGETKLLGVPWNEEEDTIQITRTRDSKVKTREEGINNTKTQAGGWAYDT